MVITLNLQAMMYLGRQGALLLVWFCLMHVGVKGIKIILFYYLVNICFEQLILMLKNQEAFEICGGNLNLHQRFWSFARDNPFISNNAASQA